jgi:hypothetical protein
MGGVGRADGIEVKALRRLRAPQSFAVLGAGDRPPPRQSASVTASAGAAPGWVASASSTPSMTAAVTSGRAASWIRTSGNPPKRVQTRADGGVALRPAGNDAQRMGGLDPAGLVAPRHRLRYGRSRSRRYGGMAVEGRDRVGQHGFAAQHPVLLGQAAASPHPATGRDDHRCGAGRGGMGVWVLRLRGAGHGPLVYCLSGNCTMRRCICPKNVRNGQNLT